MGYSYRHVLFLLYFRNILHSSGDLAASCMNLDLKFCLPAGVLVTVSDCNRKPPGPLRLGSLLLHQKIYYPKLYSALLTSDTQLLSKETADKSIYSEPVTPFVHCLVVKYNVLFLCVTLLVPSFLQNIIQSFLNKT